MLTSIHFRPRPAGRHRRPLTRPLQALSVALLLTGCARLLPSVPEDYTSDYAGDVLEAGYAYIADRYIEPVSMRELVLAGIDGLHQIDEAIIILPQASAVEISVTGAAPISVALPTNSSARRWSDFTVAAIDAARQLSPEVEEATTEALFEVVFDGALGELDPFSRYSGADEASDARALREGFGGIGLTVRMEDDFALVLSVIANAPAGRAGLQVDDKITHVNGVAVAGWTQRELIKALRGRINTTVDLTIDRADAAASFDLALRRQRIVPPTVVATRQGDATILKVASFNQRTARNIKKHVAELDRAATAGIVLDLRDNPGGLLDQAVEVADVFLERGRIVGTRGRHPHSQQAYAATGSDLSGGLPLVILVNGNTASASEVVAAALQDQQRAVIIGTNSYGKGTVQTVYRLPNDGELTLTWSRLHPPSGYRLHGLGVLPAVCSHGGGDQADVGALLDLIRISNDTGLLGQWQATDTTDKTILDPLREACASDAGSPEADIELAQILFANPALYDRMLRAGSTVVATRPDQAAQ